MSGYYLGPQTLEIVDAIEGYSYELYKVRDKERRKNKRGRNERECMYVWCGAEKRDYPSVYLVAKGTEQY